VRRIAVLTFMCLALAVAGGCRHDGRTLRPADPNQRSSVSTTSPSTTADFLDGSDGANETLVGEDTLVAPTTQFGQTTLTTTDVTAGPSTGPLTILAPWRDGAEIDARFTCDGLNVAPPLSWTAAPAGTVEIAVTLTDTDAPGFTHWVIAGISPTMIALNEDTVPLGAYEAVNGNGDLGYTGPCPPAGTTHTYVITVHYLDATTELGDGATGAEVITAIATAEIASAEVSGTFSRA